MGVLEYVGRSVKVGSMTGAELLGGIAVEGASKLALGGAGWGGAPASGRLRLEQAMSRKATNKTERFIIRTTPIFSGYEKVDGYFKGVKGKYG
jgi:hypothetical protein